MFGKESFNSPIPSSLKKTTIAKGVTKPKGGKAKIQALAAKSIKKGSQPVKRNPNMPRKHEAQYRKNHINGEGKVARHIVPAKNIAAYSTRNNDHVGNYRMGTREQNTDDLRIDNMIERREYYTHGISGGKYIRPGRVRERIGQQVESYKEMNNYSSKDMRNLYLAAREYDVDCRMFNGLQFQR